MTDRTKTHTLGPWKDVKISSENQIGGLSHEIQYGNDGELVCEGVYGKENAKLIAAAPELLEALYWIVSTCNDDQADLKIKLAVIRTKANKAMKKATN